MPNLDQLKQIITEVNPLKAKQILKMKEISELVNFLHDDEKILRITTATSKGKDYTHPGLFIATNTRCFFFYKGGLITKVIAEQFPYNKISSVGFKTGMMAADLLIDSSGASVVKLEWVDKSEVQELCEFLNSRAHSMSNQPIPVSPTDGDDIISKLERLAALKQSGALTEEEFLQAKTKLLNA